MKLKQPWKFYSIWSHNTKVNSSFISNVTLNSEVSGVDLAPPKKEKAPKQEQKVNEAKAAAKAAKKAEAKAKKAAHKAKEQAEKGAGDQAAQQVRMRLMSFYLYVEIGQEGRRWSG